MAILLFVLDLTALPCRLLQQAHVGQCSRGVVCSTSPFVTGKLGLMLPLKVWVQILCEMHLDDDLCWNTCLV